MARLARQATCFRKPLLTRPEAPVGAVASVPRQTCGHHAPGRGIADGKQPVGDRLPLDDQIEREAYPPVVERRPPGVEHEIIGTAKGRDLGRSRHSAVQPVEPLGREIADDMGRSEEHTSELQSLMRISYAVFCLKKNKIYTKNTRETLTH